MMMHSRPNKNWILIVAEHSGSDIGELMTLQNRNNYVIEAILKPNSSTDILIENAPQNSENFTKCNSVIIWAVSIDLERRFITNMTHTKCLIITEPFRYGNVQMNDKIYLRNLQIKKNHTKPSQETHTLWNVQLPQEWHRGKWYLCKAIWNLIKNKGVVRSEHVYEISVKHNSNEDCSSINPPRTNLRQAKSLAAELQENTETTVPDMEEVTKIILYISGCSTNISLNNSNTAANQTS
ncbi:hypothetical protein JTB14_027747 [Gonioctena quinquepunctata]|nr:hypothetical protein JTB14_027747 [Gonioctena quinquepunctata]